MGTLSLRLVDSMHWELLTCPRHRAGAIVIRQRDGLTERRCAAASAHEKPRPRKRNRSSSPASQSVRRPSVGSGAARSENRRAFSSGFACSDASTTNERHSLDQQQAVLLNRSGSE
jgi:hypothetical protein